MEEDNIVKREEIDSEPSQKEEQEEELEANAKEICHISLPSGYVIDLGSNLIPADRLVKISLKTLDRLQRYNGATKSRTNYAG